MTTRAPLSKNSTVARVPAAFVHPESKYRAARGWVSTAYHTIVPSRYLGWQTSCARDSAAAESAWPSTSVSTSSPRPRAVRAVARVADGGVVGASKTPPTESRAAPPLLLA
jgi:hypothetical protein